MNEEKDIINNEETEENAKAEEVEVNEEAKDAEESAPSPEEELKAEIESLKDKLMRHMAEFDNYKKRTAKEREDIYKNAVCDTVLTLLPVKDNLERAVSSESDGEESIKEGVIMVDKQFGEALKALGVEEIKSVGEVFDPEKHNAVMHEESEEADENTITEEFAKGYIYKGDKVIRHSMVKVAN